ncbi:MAG: phosphotransferase family protein, partial [Dehalococcoidia bacterium]
MTTKPADKFPGLKMALEPETVKQLLQDRLDLEDNLELSEVKIHEIHNQTRENFCAVLYNLKLKHRETGNFSEEFIFAKLLQPGESPVLPTRDSINKYNRLPGRNIKTPALHLPEAGITFYTRLTDPLLPWLVDASSQSHMKRELRHIYRSQGLQVQEVSPRILIYRPHMRASLEYNVTASRMDSDEVEPSRLIGKMDRKADPASLHTKAWALWNRTDRQEVNLPRPMGYIGSLWLTLQEFIEGQSMWRILESPEVVDLVRQVARGIAAVHNTDLPLSQWRVPQFNTRPGMISVIRPDLADRHANLTKKLASEIENRTRVRGPVHGDFHPGNMRVNNDQVTLIDLDMLAYGDPLLDIGHFLASMRRADLRTGSSHPALAQARDAFLEEYLKLAPEDLSRIYLFEAHYLSTISASAPFLRMGSSGDQMGEEFEMMLEEASLRFNEATKGKGS